MSSLGTTVINCLDSTAYAVGYQHITYMVGEYLDTQAWQRKSFFTSYLWPNPVLSHANAYGGCCIFPTARIYCSMVSRAERVHDAQQQG